MQDDPIPCRRCGAPVYWHKPAGFSNAVLRAYDVETRSRHLCGLLSEPLPVPSERDWYERLGLPLPKLVAKPVQRPEEAPAPKVKVPKPSRTMVIPSLILAFLLSNTVASVENGCIALHPVGLSDLSAVCWFDAD